MASFLKKGAVLGVFSRPLTSVEAVLESLHLTDGLVSVKYPLNSINDNPTMPLATFSPYLIGPLAAGSLHADFHDVSGLGHEDGQSACARNVAGRDDVTARLGAGPVVIPAAILQPSRPRPDVWPVSSMYFCFTDSYPPILATYFR